MVPGNPENGRKVLRNQFRYITIYRQRHNRYPADGELVDDLTANPTAYGTKNVDEALQSLMNPDNRYSDIFPSDKPRKIIVFESSNKRPDGTPAFGTKPAGTRDVVSYSDMYVHENIRQFPGQRTTVNPVGFYQVLWDDGEIEEIPYDKALYVMEKRNGRYSSLVTAFPGQAGVPGHALSYDDYWTKVRGWEVAPRGKPGGKGIAYNGQSYR